ncbi:MAG: DUF2905 domain-containing protein, partial [Gemmatimonadota bacterium]
MIYGTPICGTGASNNNGPALEGRRFHMNSSSPALLLIGLGLALIIAGVLYWSGMLGWFGRLPGDIRIENETTRIYIPIVSMLIVSAVLS